MRNKRATHWMVGLIAALAFCAGVLGAQPITVDTFPYEPDESDQASDFLVNHGSGPTAAGSSWTNGTISSPRQGTGGTSVQAWAVLPTANYAANTVTWLHSPIFDFTGVSGLELRFELWVKTNTGEAVKLQVSTNGGSTWSDVTGVSVSYNVTATALGTAFGGSNNGWGGTTYGGGSAITCAVDLNSVSGQSDVRYRWCMACTSLMNFGNNGPVVDSVRIVPVTATADYSGGYAAVPQDETVGATVTKTGGTAFTTGMTVTFGGSGVTGTVTSVANADECEVDFTADRTADVGAQMFYINLSGGTRVCEGVVHVYWPQQLVPARQGGSTQEPPGNATMGANGVYLHNGEFRHDLPIVSLPGRMLPLAVGLTYRSQLDTIGPVGAGWTASFDRRLYYWSGSDTVQIFSGDGRIDTFTLKSGGTAGAGPYIKAGFFLEITRDNNSTSGDPTDDTIEIKYAHGSVSTFEATNLDVAGEQVFRETSFADRFGNEIVMLYGSEGQLEELRGDLYDAGTPGRHRLLFDYNTHGRLSKITDHADYTGEQSVIGSSYTGAREWEFVYNSDAQLTEIKLPKTEQFYSETKGSTYRTRVQFTYDSGDNLLEVIDARQANETSPYGWLKNHYTSDKVDKQDVGRTSSGDTTHRQFIVYTSSTNVSVVNAMAFRSQYLLNGDGTASSVKHYTGTWEDDLDPISSSPIHSGDPTYLETSYEYDSEFHVIKITFPRGNYTKFRYDIGASDRRSRGNLLRVLQHPGTISTTGMPSNQVDGLLTAFTYTSAAQFNLLATSVGPRAFDLASNYDIVNHTNITTDESAYFTTTNTYNFSVGGQPDGTLQKTTTPSVDTTRSPGTLNDTQYLETEFTYNSYGQVLTAEDQAGVITEYTYGTSGFSKGYLTQVEAGAQVTPLVTAFGYNSVGRVMEVTDPLGEDFTSYTDQLDQVVRSETPQIALASNVVYYTLFTYDHNGNLTARKVSNIDETGTAQSPTTIDTTYAYNILDMVTSVTEPVTSGTTRTTTFAYDLLYRTSLTTFPEGDQAASDYDEFNRPFKSYSGFNTTNVAKGSALIQSEVFYDHNSNVITSVDGRGNDSHYTFDAYDRLTKAEDRLSSNANYTTFVYNASGQVVQATRKGAKRHFNPSGPVWSTQTDQVLGQSETLFDNIGRAYQSRVLAEKNDGTTDLSYLAGGGDGWSTSKVKFRSNGQVEETQDDLGIPTKYVYDDYSRLRRVIDDRDGSGSDDNEDEYTYDANGNVTAVTARLYDDADTGSGPHKVLTTQFFYDELNRLVEDESPTGLIRTYRYDSRSNLVKTEDRKGVVRSVEYDLLSRPIRHKTHDVTRRFVDGSGYVDTTTYDIASRTIYDKNSNVREAIDPNGNRTYMRYDLAGRWLQTQHADGGSGTPLKTTAGTTHSISQVGSTVFYSGTSAYDGNSNLLNLIDPNGTTTTWTYDFNDNPLTEDGAAAGGNPFGIIGESGADYTYDGLYRAITGKTRDGTGDLTHTDSVFNTLGGLERQRQRVYRAHPSYSAFTSDETVRSSFDEMGRRYERINPTGYTSTKWEFDRKHRPTVTKLYHSSSHVDDIAFYDYLGGGLLHSRQWRKHPGASDRPIVSTFARDDELRVTSVRHFRDDYLATSGAFGQRLIGRYDYAYDSNSMMRFEARWFEDDNNGSSTTPDEVDFYGYSTDNELEKAVYNVTKDTGGDPVDPFSTPDLFQQILDDNDSTHSDRVIYTRRKSGTRAKVTWYRGTLERTDAPTGALLDDATTPDQTTNYETSDDPGADPDSPASDGEGSRHNYTVIGQVGHTYDNNRNVLADGTREFRYNYKNELRKVWRKSDGDGTSEGRIAEYREDAFGRRVHAQTWWELGRRTYLDTRFELDIEVDHDSDSAPMTLIDGGMHGTVNPTYAGSIQTSTWPSLINRPIVENEAHYFDFLVEVPEGAEEEYFGYVSYQNFQVRIYGDNYYEAWDVSGTPTLLERAYGSSSQRRNIGIRAEDHANGQYGGVWVDGTRIFETGPTLVTNPGAGFGSKAKVLEEEFTPGLILFENLCYLRSYYRTIEDLPIQATDAPRVTSTFFDGPVDVTVNEVIDTGSSGVGVLWMDQEGDATRRRFDDHDGSNLQIYLPNGRRTTAHVVEGEADDFVRGESGLQEDTGAGPHPGSKYTIVTDAVGDPTIYVTPNPLASRIPSSFTDNAPSDMPQIGLFWLDSAIIYHGGAGRPAGSSPTSISALAMGATSGGGSPTQMQQYFQADEVECACRGENISEPWVWKGEVEPALGMMTFNVGALGDFPSGVVLTSWTDWIPFVGKEWLKEANRLAEGTKKDLAYIPKQCAEGQIEIGTKAYKWSKKVFESPEEAKEAYKAAVDDLRTFWEGVTAEDILDAIQLGLDAAGMIPGLGVGADAINGAISLGREDYLGAIVSAIAAIPAVGDALAAVLKPLLRLLKKGEIALKAVLAKIDDLFIAAVNKLPCDGAAGTFKRQLGEWFKSLKEAVEKWCFPGDVKVKTADGEKEIKDIKEGDLVWAYDETTGKWMLAEVRRLFKRMLVGTLMVLVFAWGELEVTPEHPFYAVSGQALNARDITGLHAAHNRRDAGSWIKAGNLQPGDRIESQRGRQEVLAIRTRQTREWVYNFEVAGIHTYAVGSHGLVAHNDCHHIMTNKNSVSTARGGPWTPKFEEMAKKANMKLEDAANKVDIPGHKGPHPEAYHQAVYDRLQSATAGLDGSAYETAFKTELAAIKKDVATPGSALNKLVTKE